MNRKSIRTLQAERHRILQSCGVVTMFPSPVCTLLILIDVVVIFAPCMGCLKESDR